MYEGILVKRLPASSPALNTISFENKNESFTVPSSSVIDDKIGTRNLAKIRKGLSIVDKIGKKGANFL